MAQIRNEYPRPQFRRKDWIGLQAKLEHKQILIALLLEQYTDMSTQQKLKTLDQYLSEELPKLLELQEKAKQ